MRELARRSDFSHGTVSNVIGERTPPSADFCIGIAKALHLNPEYVLYKAGHLAAPPAKTENLTLREIWSIISSMDDDQLHEVRRYARYVLATDAEESSRASGNETRSQIENSTATAK